MPARIPNKNRIPSSPIIKIVLSEMADSIPVWADSKAKRKLWGRAKQLGADAAVLSNEDATEGFVDQASLSGKLL